MNCIAYLTVNSFRQQTDHSLNLFCTFYLFPVSPLLFDLVNYYLDCLDSIFASNYIHQSCCQAFYKTKQFKTQELHLKVVVNDGLKIK